MSKVKRISPSVSVSKKTLASLKKTNEAKVAVNKPSNENFIFNLSFEELGFFKYNGAICRIIYPR